MTLSRVSKADATALLMESGSEGMYILRESNTEPGLVVLAVRVGPKVDQYMIKPDPAGNGTYKLGKVAGTLSQIIEHHRRTPLQNVLLTQPLPTAGRRPPIAAAARAESPTTSIPNLPSADQSRSFVLNDVSKRPVWFHGGLSKDQAESLLMEGGKTGSFLVRTSPNNPDEYALALRREENDVKHLKITLTPNGMYSLGDNHGPFPSIAALIDTYRTSASLWATKLVDPVPMLAAMNITVSVMKSGTLFNTVLPKGVLQARMYNVDEMGYFLLYKVAVKDSKELREQRWLPFRNIVEIRRGTNTRTFLQNKSLISAPLAFSILYRDGTADIQSLDLIASTNEEYELWLAGLDYLLGQSRRATDPSNWEEFIRNEWLAMGLNIESLDNERIVNRTLELFIKRLHTGLPSDYYRVMVNQALVGAVNQPNVADPNAKLTFTVYSRMFAALKAQRSDLSHLFQSSFLKMNEFHRFLVEQQRGGARGNAATGSLAGLSSSSAQNDQSRAAIGSSSSSLMAQSSAALITEREASALLAKYETSPLNVQNRVLSRQAFYRFLLSRDNDIFDQRHLSVFQDMTRPLSQYYIATSHNTSLILDTAAVPEVAIDGFMRLLLSGVRCLHLEVYDGDVEPIVSSRYVMPSKSKASVPGSVSSASGKHMLAASQSTADPNGYAEWKHLSGGGVGTDKRGKAVYVSVPLSQVLQVVLTHGFVASPYPVILVVINRCSAPFQNRMADLFKSILGDGVLAAPLSEATVGNIPSPSQLKGRVLIMASKQVTDTDWFDDDFDLQPAAPQAQPNARVSADGSPRILVENAFSNLVFLDLNRFQSLARGRRMPMFEVPAIDERHSTEFLSAESSVVALQDITLRNLVHNRPYSRRDIMTNMDPIPAWNAGIQMVGVNHCSRGLAVKFHQARFRVNGNCGYVQKPRLLTSGSSRGTSSGGNAGVKLVIQVISAQQLRRPTGPRLERPSTANTNDKPISPMIVVETCGQARDSMKFSTAVIRDNNGFDPLWQADTKFVFNLNSADLTFLRFAAYDDSTRTLLGQAVYPVTSLNDGYRHVRLCDDDNEPIDQSTVFVHISVRELSTLGGRIELALDDLIQHQIVPFTAEFPSPNFFLGQEGAELLAEQYGTNAHLMRLLKSLETMRTTMQRSRTLIDEINAKLLHFGSTFVSSTDEQSFRFTYHMMPEGAHNFRLCNVYEYSPAQDVYSWRAYFFLY
ncbi:hypothetical protein CAOG_05500 [Capsaspora owczarzaki ATCC 30864]|uniref:Phosphoinositide phospholipase C n=1 Tax=Capsaspora owczarzaki (strain ATCC 30864) TaxID=595528 RepID=A0A0D2X3V4_CAPO3|nr:hypothetical protein CAOG_05500 [Capsaspora owczarzaki ATCC 30864]KJE94964.1 hypothetical protein CAOG_005500 [Capsaspora owczarzaki ATCC 30864]|eukprot:XP_004346173.2 hypothetical protein CAOG_05500 [Capsaspora owczarzaki ATCC 30864]